VHVHKERPTGDDLLLALAARLQLSLRLLRHGADSPNRSHGRGPRQDTADSSYRSGAGVTPKGKRIRRLLLQNADPNRLELELTHPADCSDAISAIRPRSRKLRL
jgi:hypothetical protein